MRRWLSVSALVILLDQITKYWAVKYLVLQQPVKVNNFFNLMLDYNHGAAFSFLSTRDGWQQWLFTGIAIVISSVIVMRLKKLPRDKKWEKFSLALILGGALGNVIDRVYHGKVTDFISWHIHGYYWPTFNIADSAVCVGAVLLMMSFNRGVV